MSLGGPGGSYAKAKLGTVWQGLNGHSGRAAHSLAGRVVPRQ